MKTNILLLFIAFFQLSLSAQSDFPKIKISEDIELLKLSKNTYVHVSVADFGNFGKVSSNGLLIVENGEAFLFDTPATGDQTEALANFAADSLHAKIVGFIPNHWHDDCVAGLDFLHKMGVKSYANQMTIDICKKENKPVPQTAFTDSLHLNFHGTDIFCYYLGGGHTADNIVVWLPAEQILFGGCMVKDINSSNLGNTTDAVIGEWATTIEKVINKFPQAEIIIPGHGKIGDKETLKHTIKLLKEYEKSISK